MRLCVDSEVFERFSTARIGVVVAVDVDNATQKPELVADLDRAQGAVEARLAGTPIVRHPAIACWRDAYRAFGARPKKHRSSVEALARRALARKVPSINPLVDLYNAVCLRHLLPVGGEDIDRIAGDEVVLRFAGESEPEVALLGDPVPRAPNEGEVIYTDSVGAICRRWNWREADRTKLTAETTRVMLVVESLAPTPDDLEVALLDLENGLSRHLGASTLRGVASPRRPELNFAI